MSLNTLSVNPFEIRTKFYLFLFPLAGVIMVMHVKFNRNLGKTSNLLIYRSLSFLIFYGACPEVSDLLTIRHYSFQEEEF